mmetsp:Transcript_19354/g.38840  ORF Transcript_19354/g.38840 Transcript_19354/m.38840 type:complete len:692 (+) Transcript_19354:62-2137(+)
MIPTMEENIGNAYDNAPATIGSPVVVITDHQDVAGEDVPPKKKSKSDRSNCKKTKQSSSSPLFAILKPESDRLLDDMLHPLSKARFFKHHFRKDAVCIQRRPQPFNEERHHKKGQNKHVNGATTTQTLGNKDMVSHICQKYLFDLDARQIFAETSSENVFLWLRPPQFSTPQQSNTTAKSSTRTSSALNSVEITDPETAYVLHRSGSHPAYCRAPPELEQLLVGNLLRQTGLGGGQYHPPHDPEMVSLGGNMTLGRGEVELFIGADSGSDFGTKPFPKVGKIGGADAKNNPTKHTTGWHTDFQENFTIQLSGIKKWTLRRGNIRHPIRATTPHYCREASVVENQLKVARMSRKNYGFEYDDNNTLGEEKEIYLYPGDVLYFPSGMWHKVESVEAGVSMNVSLMGTTWASLVCNSLQHLLLGQDERWREVVTFRPPNASANHSGGDDGVARLQKLLGELPEIIRKFTTESGGAISLMPPALCYPQRRSGEVEEEEEKWIEELQRIGEDADSDVDEAASDSVCIDGDENGADMTNEEVDEADHMTWGIVVSLDDFVGPPGWSSDEPSNASLVKNPLASLIPMAIVTTPVTGSDIPNNGPKKYILNVNYAGNEMCESHVRVVLETIDHIDLMDWYIGCESKAIDAGKLYCEVKGLVKSTEEKLDLSRTSSDERYAGSVPPTALFYYGYFSWNKK